MQRPQLDEPTMTWQANWTRIRAGLASAGTWLNWRVVRRLAGATAAAGLLSTGFEAMVRAKLDRPLARIPTAIYSRPIRWGAASGRATPILVAAVDEARAERRTPVVLHDVPRHLIEAILAVEDQRFYRHHGLDFRRIGGALLANIRAHQISQGGSTITQQLAKNLFLSAERTPLRKLREMTMALVLEARYSKATILEAYLNEIYLGQDGGHAILGVGAASRFYFGKDVGKITLPESALLAGMIQAPNRFSPTRHELVARSRRML